LIPAQVAKEAKMKIVVVYESLFGNTKTIGEGIAEAVGGPLVDGERERAAAWGRELAAKVKLTVSA